MLRLETEVQFVKGVGPQRSALFKSRGIRTVGDLLLHIPKSYQDRANFVRLDSLHPGQDAAIHARMVDWPAILELYDRLFAMNPTPVVALNRAVAIARVRGAEEALASIEGLKLPGYYLSLAVRGHLLLDLHRYAEAAACFGEALNCRCSEPERRFLRRKIEECAAVASERRSS